MAHQFFRQGRDKRRRIKHLVRAESRDRTGHDVPHVIHARLQGGESGFLHHPEDDGNLLNTDLPSWNCCRVVRSSTPLPCCEAMSAKARS